MKVASWKPKLLQLETENFMAGELTTIQISKEYSEKLEALADTYKRSKKSHIEWLIDQDYKKLAAVKLVKKLKEETGQTEPMAAE